MKIADKQSQHTDDLATKDEASKTVQNQNFSALDSEVLRLSHPYETAPTKKQTANTSSFLNESGDCKDISEISELDTQPGVTFVPEQESTSESQPDNQNQDIDMKR